MTSVVFIFEFAIAFSLAAYLLQRYGNWRKQHPVVTAAVFISWLFSLLIIFLLSLDVSSTYYRQCLHDQCRQPVTDLLHSLSNSSLLPTSQNSSAFLNRFIHPTISSFSFKSNNTYNYSTESPNSYPDCGETCKKPWSILPLAVLPALWRVVYWTSQALTWLIMPIMKSYSRAGDFSIAGKLKTSVIENALWYGTYLIIFLILLIYLVAFRPELHLNGFQQLKVLAVTASNTWGLFLLVFMMGYGLVEVPRAVWSNSRRSNLLSKAYFQMAKISIEKAEAEEQLEDILDDIKRASDSIRYNHPLRRFVDTILEKCPESMRQGVSHGNDDYQDYNPGTNQESVTKKSLVRIHADVIAASQMYRRTQCQWRQLIDRIFHLEDIVSNEVSYKHEFIHSFKPAPSESCGCYSLICSPRVEWYWKCLIEPISMKVFSILLVIFSLMVICSEVLFFVRSPVLSLFAIFVQLGAENYNYFSIEIASCIIVSYLCVTSYYTVFRMRIFNYFYLVPHHQTDENSLIFSGMMFCRLTPPLCLNFLGLIHLDSHLTKSENRMQTAYTQIMGHMDVIPFISDGFNIYFPILVVVICIATYFRLASRFLHCFGIQQFVTGDDEITQELIDEGKSLMQREKRKRQRETDSVLRRHQYHENYNKFRGRDDKDSSSVNSSSTTKNYKFFGHKVQGSSDDDCTELLNQIEPIEYSQETSRFDEPLNSGFSNKSSVNQTTRSKNRPLPHGIFDDV